MAKKTKELSQVKARQTKLGKKTVEELIQIILKKDKIERNINAQVKNLKGEVNALSTRVKNFDSDMEGTYKTLEEYKDRVTVLTEANANITASYNEVSSLYTEETKKTVALEEKVDTWQKVSCAAILLALLLGVAVIL